MPRYDAVIFDFDGTFTDSAEGILASANTAFEEMDFPLMGFPEFKRFLGPPLQESFIQFCGMTQEQARQAIAIYRREYDAGNCMRTRVYDGMEPLLRRLRAAGIKTAVASSKPAVFLEKILDGLGMRDLFDAVCGPGLGFVDSSKSGLIAEAARQCGVPPARCLMAGDRRFDIEGAKALGMPNAGALWGFGSREELEEAGADFLVEQVGSVEGGQGLQGLEDIIFA